MCCKLHVRTMDSRREVFEDEFAYVERYLLHSVITPLNPGSLYIIYQPRHIYGHHCMLPNEFCRVGKTLQISQRAKRLPCSVVP